MVDLTAHGGQVRSVFDLLGTKELALTAAVGFLTSRSAALCNALLGDLKLGCSMGPFTWSSMVSMLRTAPTSN